jgi:hypothetical protein
VAITLSRIVPHENWCSKVQRKLNASKTKVLDVLSNKNLAPPDEIFESDTKTEIVTFTKLLGIVISRGLK